MISKKLAIAAAFVLLAGAAPALAAGAVAVACREERRNDLEADRTASAAAGDRELHVVTVAPERRRRRLHRITGLAIAGGSRPAASQPAAVAQSGTPTIATTR